MTYTVGIGFKGAFRPAHHQAQTLREAVATAIMGGFRPAYFQAETLREAVETAIAASRGMAEADQVGAWIQQCARNVRNRHWPYFAIEHGSLSVSIRRAPHDPFLDSVTQDMPQCPGLDYSGCANK